MIERRKQTPSWICACTVLLATLLMTGPLAAQELGWPREIVVPEGKVVMYQPQADSFEDDLLTGRAAVSVTPTGQNEPVFGAVWMKSRVATDRDTRSEPTTPANGARRAANAIKEVERGVPAVDGANKVKGG